jgi:phosphoribosyl-dephospho-CoA transferase
MWLAYGYIITVPKDSDLVGIKKTCIPLELDSAGNRIADIDVYREPLKKISRKDLGL